MWTSKSGPRVWCFPHFDSQICFAPQPRAIFEHRNFQNGSGNVVFCAFFSTFALQMCFSPQLRAIFGHLNYQKWPESVVFSTFWLTNMLRATAACNFWTSQLPKWLRECGVLCIFFHICLANVLLPTAACHFWTSELPKVARECGVFHILTYKYASRHSGVQFLNIATSKMAPGMWCFVHFDLQMRFSPQPRGILEHRNFQNGSGNVVFCAFWLANVLFATAASHFGTSELPKWLRECGVLCILTCKCAFRHSRVAFWNIGTSKMSPALRCFFLHFDAQMCFAPQPRAIFHLSAQQLPPHPPL